MQRRGILVLTVALFVLSSDAHASTPDDATAAIKRKLSRKVTFEFENTPMVEALHFLQILTQTNVMVDPQMSREKSTFAVTLTVKDVPLRDALERILDPAGLEYSIRSEAIYIREKGAPAEAAGKPKLSKSLEARLAKKVSFEFVEVPFSEVIIFMRKLGGVAIEVPEAVADEANFTPITLKVTNMPLRIAIDWILKLANLSYKQQGDGLVCMLPPAAKKAPKARKVKAVQAGPAFPAVMVVVDCARATDRNTGLKLLAYLTRDRLAGKNPSRSVFGSFKLLAATSVTAARRAAKKTEAFGILRVIIDKRTRDVRMPGQYSLFSTLAFYTLAPAKGRARPKWKLTARQRIVPALRRGGFGLEITGSDGFDTNDDPLDFRKIAADIATLVRTAAVGLKKARLTKAPGGGLQLEVEVTNNTKQAIAGIDVSLGKTGDEMCSYSGDPIPPGTTKVTIPVPRAKANRLRPGNQSPTVRSVTFSEVAEKK